MTTRLPLLAAGLLFVSTASAADWPTFRGANRDGMSKETGLLKSWPKEGPSKVWTASNLGLGFGAPIVSDGRIFGLGTRDEKDGMWALKEADGSELWFTPFADSRRGDPNSGPSGAPTYSQGKVYATSSNGKLICLDATDGKKVWSADYADKEFGGRAQGWGFTESPLVDGDKVIVTRFGQHGRRPTESGKVIWKTSQGRGRWSGRVRRRSRRRSTFRCAWCYWDIGQGSPFTPKREAALAVHPPRHWRGARIPMPAIKGDLVWFSTSRGARSSR